MPTLVKTKAETNAQKYNHWIGQEYVCNSDGNTYKITKEDLENIAKVQIGDGYRSLYVDAIKCPCGGHVYVNSDYRGEVDVTHIQARYTRD